MATSLLKHVSTLSSRSISSLNKFLPNKKCLLKPEYVIPSISIQVHRDKSKMVYKRSGPRLKTGVKRKPNLKALIENNKDTPKELLDEIQSQQFIPQEDDMPLSDLPNPYQEPKHKCFLCVNRVELDYKNVQLLSQFISPHTGQIYGRHISGLCIPMQKRIAQLIKRSRYFGFMPYVMKEPTYLHDPKLFDPFKRKKYTQ